MCIKEANKKSHYIRSKRRKKNNISVKKKVQPFK